MKSEATNNQQTNNTQGGLLELVDILHQIDEKQTNARLSQYSMNNFYFGKNGNDSELRTWFYHYKTLKKSGIMNRDDKTMER